MTPEEKIAASLDALWEALGALKYNDNTRARMLYAATPAITAHYLKGQ